MFDKSGNLIGVISSKHLGAENASYAIKVSYLKSLIELIDNPIDLQNSSALNDKSLTRQVEIVRKFVYIIEGE